MVVITPGVVMCGFLVLRQLADCLDGDGDGYVLFGKWLVVVRIL